MPRIARVLAADLRKIFALQLEDIGEISSRIASAYQSYATGAQGPMGEPVVLQRTEYRIFQRALADLMRGRSPAPKAAIALGRAIMSFWLAPPVKTATGGLCASIVTAGAVARMRAINVKRSDQAATSLANALHMMTSTVFVAYPPSPIPRPPGFLL